MDRCNKLRAERGNSPESYSRVLFIRVIATLGAGTSFPTDSELGTLWIPSQQGNSCVPIGKNSTSCWLMLDPVANEEFD